MKNVDMVSQATLQRLVSEKETPLVSICLPIHHEGGVPMDEARGNTRLLLAALAGAEQRLGSTGLSAKGCTQFLAGARQFAEEQLPTLKGGQSLLLLMSPSLFEVHTLAQPMPESMTVGNRFYVTPLLPLLHKHTECFILTLSKDRAQLHHVTETGVEQVEVPGMPTSVAEAWKGLERQDGDMQSHAGGSAGMGGPMFHGQGGAKDTMKMELEVYVQKVTSAVDDALSGQHAPLLFAGIEEEFGMFRKHSKYPHLSDSFVRGNPDGMTLEELRTHAIAALQPLWEKEKDVVLEAYGNLSGSGRTSTDLAAVVDLARQGKVETLLVAEGIQQWGAFHEDTGIVQLHDRQEQGDEEALGLAALHTLLHRGWVQTFPQDKMPEGRLLAAVLRY